MRWGRPIRFPLPIPVDSETHSGTHPVAIPEESGHGSERSDEGVRSLVLDRLGNVLLSHRGTAQLDDVSVVHEAVADGIGDRGT